MKKSIIVVLFLVLNACKSEKFESFPNYEHVRKNELKLNLEAENALNKISTILNGTDTRKDLNSTSAQSSEIFFNLSNKEQNFYISRTNFRNFQFNEISSHTDYKIPLEELSTDNIDLFLDNMPMFGGNYASVTITSKFDNKKAFLNSRTNIDKNEIVTIDKTFKEGNCSFIVSQENGIEFKKQLIIFLNNYRKLL